MTQYNGAFVGSRNKDRDVLIYDQDVDITIAVGDHPHGAHPLYREALPQGNIAAYYRPNTRTSGLSVLQRAISTTKYGKTWSLQLDAKGCEVSRTELDDEVAVREQMAFMALEGQETEGELFVETACRLPMSEVKKVPFQGRQNLCLKQELVADDAELEGLDLEEFEEVFQSLLMSDSPASIQVLRKMLPMRVQATSEAELVRLQALGIDWATPVSFREEPAQKPTWGLPKAIYTLAKLRKKQFEGEMALNPMTCEEVSDMALKELGSPIPALKRRGAKRVSYDDIQKVFIDEERRYFREYESWANGTEVPVRLMNMGAAVEEIRETLEDGYEARPRASINEVPLSEEALGDFAQQSLERDLLRRSTPRDEQVFMGELTPWASDIPYYVTEEGKFVGHPAARIIHAALEALNDPHDPRFIFDIDGQPLMLDLKETVRLRGVTPERLVTLSGRNYMTCTVGGSRGLMEVAPNADGTTTVHLTARCPDQKFDYEVQASDREILGRPDQDGMLISEGSVLCFNSRMEYVNWRSQYAMFPTISVDEDGRAECSETGIRVTYLPLSQVFPKVDEFLQWAVGEYAVGVGFVTHDGMEDEIPEWMWTIHRELSVYQKRMLDIVAETNLEEDVFVAAREAIQSGYELVSENPMSATAFSFSSADGQQSTLYGSMWSFVRAAVQGLNEERAILPAPMKVTAQTVDDDGTDRQFWGINARTLWRVMGYGLHPDKFQPGLDHLHRMVAERILTPSPLDAVSRSQYWRDDDGTVHRFRTQSKLVTWTDSGDFTTGILGDELAQWWELCVGIQNSAVKGNLLAMSQEELEKRLGWSRREVQNLREAVKGWGRRTSCRHGGLDKLIEILLPLPKLFGADKVGTYPIEGAMEVFRRRLIQQAMLKSSAPRLSEELMMTAFELLEAEQLARSSFLAMCRRGVDEVGEDTIRVLTSLLV